MSADNGARRTPSANPHRLVERVEMRTLVEALYAGRLLAVIDDDTGLRWICSHCRACTHNGGTAYPVSWSRWRCSRCQFTGTRFQLERQVLESAGALAELFRLSKGDWR